MGLALCAAFSLAGTQAADKLSETPKVTVIARPKPGFIIFVSQCGRPLTIYGVDTASYFYEIDAQALTPTQVQAIAGEVDAAHRTIKDVPCVGHPRGAKVSKF